MTPIGGIVSLACAQRKRDPDDRGFSGRPGTQIPGYLERDGGFSDLTLRAGNVSFAYFLRKSNSDDRGFSDRVGTRII